MLPRSDDAPPAPLIYVVEDDDAITKLVVAALHEFGFATEAFRNGATLLRRLQTERPDLCVEISVCPTWMASNCCGKSAQCRTVAC